MYYLLVFFKLFIMCKVLHLSTLILKTVNLKIVICQKLIKLFVQYTKTIFQIQLSHVMQKKVDTKYLSRDILYCSLKRNSVRVMELEGRGRTKQIPSTSSIR